MLLPWIEFMKDERNTRFISTIHCNLMIAFSVMYLAGKITQKQYEASLIISYLYLLWDSIATIYHWKSFGLSPIINLLHHGLFFVWLICLNLTNDPYYTELYAWGYLMEISTVILNIAWMSREVYGKNSKITLGFGLMGLLAFFLFRMILLPYLIYKFNIKNSMIILVSGIFYILFSYWFYKMIKIVQKLFKK
jgi:hypothetical protein